MSMSVMVPIKERSKTEFSVFSQTEPRLLSSDTDSCGSWQMCQDEWAPIGSLNTTFEIENVNLNIQIIFACLDFLYFGSDFAFSK